VAGNSISFKLKMIEFPCFISAAKAGKAISELGKATAIKKKTYSRFFLTPSKNSNQMLFSSYC
jgi:hypothetical protein